MEKLIALFKLYVLRKLDLGQLTSAFDKLEEDLGSFCAQQVELAEKLKAKADKLEVKRYEAVRAKEKAERIAGKIKALVE